MRIETDSIRESAVEESLSILNKQDRHIPLGKYEKHERTYHAMTVSTKAGSLDIPYNTLMAEHGVSRQPRRIGC